MCIFPHSRSSQCHRADRGTGRSPLLPVIGSLFSSAITGSLGKGMRSKERPFSQDEACLALGPILCLASSGLPLPPGKHSTNLPDGCFFLRHPGRGGSPWGCPGTEPAGQTEASPLLDSWGPRLKPPKQPKSVPEKERKPPSCAFSFRWKFFTH